MAWGLDSGIWGVPRLDMVRPLAQAFVAGPVARMCALAVSLLPRMHMCCLKLGAPPAPPEESNAALWPPLSFRWRTTRNLVLKVCKGFRADAAADAAVLGIFLNLRCFLMDNAAVLHDSLLCRPSEAATATGKISCQINFGGLGRDITIEDGSRA